MLNGFSAAINERKSEPEIMALVGELTEYANMHFATEEKYFDQFGYSGAAEHKEAHRKLKESAAAFMKNRNGKDVYVFTNEVLEFMIDWLVDHLEHMDKKYVEFFHEHGLK